ncbi:TetR/AcrR family transcriptional regulator C-terminal domain-containing protein [Streptomyces roseoverticillatus]|uniref:TetR/AcrR family transcriptional regulator C-terminal domain-containing protein n=1 Tax=Streptomyces roseoverticillatus TaxID=66429 RepID=UPI001F2248D6|nr:TetR/AcrR family transcriptional regulator C-terminal domain-containing protein [Streptomyces roseoverticillatus]MCF3105923.1 TetR/AcrR family transcriptional regulator C-terminal domain-containing protein [Streptomyces roseoverticillatus]
MEPTGKRTALTREKVLRAALDVADRDGIDKLSMRRLGAELGVEAMSLYHYLPNKAALLDGLVELVTSAVRPDNDSPADQWTRRLRNFAVALRAELLRHPGMIPLVATRPARSVAALQAVEDTAAALGRAGIPPLDALHLINSVATLVTGHCLAEASDTPGHPEQSTEDTPDLAAFPVLATAVAAGLGTPQDHQTRFDLALDALLDGLQRGQTSTHMKNRPTTDLT